MLAYFRDNISQVSDGLLFGLGLLTVYFGAVITGSSITSSLPRLRSQSDIPRAAARPELITTGPATPTAPRWM